MLNNLYKEARKIKTLYYPNKTMAELEQQNLLEENCIVVCAEPSETTIFCPSTQTEFNINGDTLKFRIGEDINEAFIFNSESGFSEYFGTGTINGEKKDFFLTSTFITNTQKTFDNNFWEEQGSSFQYLIDENCLIDSRIIIFTFGDIIFIYANDNYSNASVVYANSTTQNIVVSGLNLSLGWNMIVNNEFDNIVNIADINTIIADISFDIDISREDFNNGDPIEKNYYILYTETESEYQELYITYEVENNIKINKLAEHNVWDYNTENNELKMH
jgi:hypothetical protein